MYQVQIANFEIGMQIIISKKKKEISLVIRMALYSFGVLLETYYENCLPIKKKSFALF